MHYRSGLISSVAIIVVAGCSVTTTAAPGEGGSGTGGASSAQTADCKKGCDKMKFFDCSSAEEQAKCYADCDSATPQQIEVFTACAQNSICDPECRTSIVPKEKASSGGGGASASSCGTACDKLISCSFIPVGAKAECNTRCAAEGYQYQIDCVNKNACGDIESKCGGISSTEEGTSSGGISSGGIPGPDPKAECLDECDSVNFFDCTTVEKHSDCRDRCDSATTSSRDTFVACSKSSGVDCDKKAGCLDAFLK
jgi:hypothetical protein